MQHALCSRRIFEYSPAPAVLTDQSGQRFLNLTLSYRSRGLVQLLNKRLEQRMVAQVLQSFPCWTGGASRDGYEKVYEFHALPRSDQAQQA